MANEKEVGFKLVVNGAPQAVKSIAEIEQAMIDLKKEAKNADIGSEAAERAKLEFQKAQAALKEFRNDTVKTKEIKEQFTDMGNSVSSSLSVAEDSLRAFGVENEAVSKGVQIANAVIIGINQLRAVSETKVEQAVARRTIAEKAAAAATKVWTGIQAAFNAVMALNPIGLVVIAIAALVAAIALLWEPIKKLTNSFSFLNDAVTAVWDAMRDFASWISGGAIDDAATAKTRENADKIVAAIEDVSGAQQRAIEASDRYVERLKNQGASEEEINQASIRSMKLKFETAKAGADALRALVVQGIKLDDKQKESLANFEKTMKETWQSFQNMQDAETKKAREKAKAYREKAIAENKAFIKKMEEDSKSYFASTMSLYDQVRLMKISDPLKKELEKANIEFGRYVEKTAKDIAETFGKGDNIANDLFLGLRKIFDSPKTNMEMTELGNKLFSSLGLSIPTGEKGDAIWEKMNQLFMNLKYASEKFALDNAAILADALADENKLRSAKLKEINDAEVAEFERHGEVMEELYLWGEYVRIAAMEEGYDKEKELRDLNFQEELRAIGEKYTNEAEYQEAVALLKEEYRLKEKEANEKQALELFELKMNALSAEFGLAQQFGQLILQVDEDFGRKGNTRRRGFAAAAIGIEKAAAIGQIWANNAVANAKAVAAFPLTAGMPWVAINTVGAGISTAAVIASALKAIQDLYAVKTEAGGGGSGSGETPQPGPSKFARGGLVEGPGTSVSDSIPAMLSKGESVMTANATQNFGGLLSAINVASGGNPIGTNSTSPIIKAYVVSSDMTSQQEADKKIKDLARI